MHTNKFIVLEYDLLECRDLTNTDKVLYGYIVALSQNESGSCYASSERLCELVGLKERQLYYSLAKLREYKFITIENKKLIGLKNRRVITPTINEYIESRFKENKRKRVKVDLIEYDWLNE